MRGLHLRIRRHDQQRSEASSACWDLDAQGSGPSQSEKASPLQSQQPHCLFSLRICIPGPPQRVRVPSAGKHESQRGRKGHDKGQVAGFPPRPARMAEGLEGLSQEQRDALALFREAGPPPPPPNRPASPPPSLLSPLSFLPLPPLSSLLLSAFLSPTRGHLCSQSFGGVLDSMVGSFTGT